MTNYTAAFRRARRRTWIGIGLATLAVIFILAIAFSAGTRDTGDSQGTNDAGVVHPQPVGVDDDVAGD